MRSKWMVYQKKADFKEIQNKYGIDQVIARIMRNRDIEGDDEINLYLNGDVNNLYSPYLLKDAEKTADILKNKIKDNKKIRIIGDYDIDGVCSISILYKALKRAGADVDYVVPHRIYDGYGINENLIDDAIKENIDTIITCDNGIAAIPQIHYAKENKLTVLVTDHHDIPFKQDGENKILLSSEADTIIDPKQPECDYPFEKICGAAVAFKLVQILYDKMNLNKSDIKEYLELMAIATVGDVVDLKDENRIIVKKGLKSLASTNNKGIRALTEICKLDIHNLTAYHIGFVIGPCINASGRLDTAQKAIDLLLCEDSGKAYEMAQKLKDLNDERKKITENETKKAIDLIENSELIMDNVLVVYLAECHESVAGIIAGRIREKYYRPSIVITDSMEGAKGSGRSIDAYNMFEEISKCGHLLTKYGGHPLAAGLSLPKENIDLFRKELNDNQKMTEKQLTPITWIDVPMPVSYVTMNLIEQLSVLEPFGKGNEKPIFADKNLTVKSLRRIGNNKDIVKMQLQNNENIIIDAIKFNTSNEWVPNIGDKIAMVYYPSINEFNGSKTIQFVIKEIQISR